LEAVLRFLSRPLAGEVKGSGEEYLMKTSAEILCELLAKGEEAVLATIISHQGSTPRTAGTRMVISEDGRGHGTIGGGTLEARVLEAGRELLAGGCSRMVSFDLSYDAAAATEMICGGRVEILLDRVVPTPEDSSVFARWRQAQADREDGLFVTVIAGAEGNIERIDHGLVLADGTVHGRFPLSSSALHEVARQGRALRPIQVMKIENTTVVVEPVRKPKTLYLFGAGHVAQPTAHLASLVGFRVAVMDDREEFANAARFPEADVIRVLPDFNRAGSEVPVDGDSFVVIVTRGHAYDQTVLAQILKTEAGYVGMIGSRRKREAIYRALLTEGFTHEDLRRVHCPIGLDIGAETPEEIAVSIVAELVRHRARGVP
jgi:xanthine dehydrogenase accessory factor